MPQSDETTSNESGRRRSRKSPEPDTGPTCGQCGFWRRQEGDEGACFRLPPVVMSSDDGVWLVRPFPEASEPACGEFKGAN